MCGPTTAFLRCSCEVFNTATFSAKEKFAGGQGLNSDPQFPTQNCWIDLAKNDESQTVQNRPELASPSSLRRAGTRKESRR